MSGLEDKPELRARHAVTIPYFEFREVLAVRQLNTYATGTVLYRITNRWPQNGRIDAPAKRAHVVVGHFG